MPKLSDFDYELPEELIAQFPALKRDFSKMMVVHADTGYIEHKHFYDIIDYLNETDVLILNNTKVIPARLYGYKDTGAKIEILLLKPQKFDNAKEQRPTSGFQNNQWEVLIRPSKRVQAGTLLKISDDFWAKVITPIESDGKWLVELKYKGNIYDVLKTHGLVPLPPYIERKTATETIKKLDCERYQTVYAEKEGSIAAPTAGLHFTEEIIQKLKNKGVQTGFITLNVGLGTFRPVKCDNIEDHKMDSETYYIPKETAELINNAQKSGKKITAVGTTTVRTLESAFAEFGVIKECSSTSALFIYPPYKFNVIDRLITNFHLPKSTLLMLVAAFAGKDCIFDAYRIAVENKYRFYSYGDCMLIDR